MTGSPVFSFVFSVNFINRTNPAKPNYHMSINKQSSEMYSEYRTVSHLVFSTHWPAVELKKVLSTTKHGFVFWARRKPNARLTFLYWHMTVNICCIFSIFEIFGGYRSAGHLVFSHSSWPAVELKKFLKCHKTCMVLSSEPSVNQTLHFRSIKHFRIAWLFLIDIW